MYSLAVENESGSRLQLTQNEKNYQIVKVDGLLPPKAIITTSQIASMDGARFKSSKLEMRNIVITIKIKGNIEKNRIALYDYFDNGKPCKIFYKNNSRDVFCIGYCEDVNGDLFVINQTIQVSVLCPEPYWFNRETKFVDPSFIQGFFEFPFFTDSTGFEFSKYVYKRETEVINDGEVEIGMIIKLGIKNINVTEPVIYNVETGEFFKINSEFGDSQQIVINTNRGQKEVYFVLNGVKHNLFNMIGSGSTWLQLKKGSNLLTYNASSGAEGLSMTVEFNTKYKGV